MAWDTGICSRGNVLAARWSPRVDQEQLRWTSLKMDSAIARWCGGKWLSLDGVPCVRDESVLFAC
jgi:hypothetical protein